MIVNSAIYVEGRRIAAPDSLSETYETVREVKGLAWIGLYKPTSQEFASVAEEFELHDLAVEDAVRAHQRPKLDRYGDTLFVALRAARYLEVPETVEFSELHVFVGPDFVVSVRHGEGPNLDRVRERMESEPELLARGSEAVLYAILDQVVDDYAPVVAGLENDIDEIETAVFGGNANVTRRTYELAREVIEFQRAIKPLHGMITNLIAGGEKYGVDAELQAYLRDVQDHVIQVQEQAAGFRDLLQNILSVNLNLVALQQNDEVKRISAWAAILFAPTLVGTVYGMNFSNMPEVGWRWGYPFSIMLMLAISVIMWAAFRRRGWLS